LKFRIAILPLVLVALGAAAPLAYAEGFQAAPAGSESSGRAGVDLAVARDSMALRSNPAGLAWMQRNRSDVSIRGLFNKIDLEAGPSGQPYNGDQSFFGVNWAYAFIPSRLATDPFREWSLVKHKAMESFTARSRYAGRIEAPLRTVPKRVDLRGSGTGFWISEIVLRAAVPGEQTWIRYRLPPVEDLGPDRPVTECSVEFEYRLTGKPEASPPSLTLSAYGQNESALLKGKGGAWHKGKITLVLSPTGLPPEASLTSVAEATAVELKSIVFLRTFGQGGLKNQARTAVEDEEIVTEVDPGGNRIILATSPGPFRAVSQEQVLWSLAESGRFKGEILASLCLEFRYGFEGGGAKGKLALLVDGKEVARKDYEPAPEVPPAGEEMARRRRAVDWMEKEKVHLGFGFFTDTQIGAGFNSLPSDVGLHEGQLRYTMYSLTVGGAVQVHPMLAVGASIDVSHGRFLNFDGLLFQSAESVVRNLAPTYLAQTGKDRVSLQFDSNNLFGWGGAARIGLLARPVENLMAGVTFQSPMIMSRHGGKAQVDLSDDFSFTGFDTWLQANVFLPLGGNYGFDGEYDAYVTGFTLPLRAGVGLAYRVADKLTVAVDGEFVGWSKALDRLTLKFTRGSNPDSDILTGNTFKARLPLRFRDQWTAALGLSADLHEMVTVHAGYRWARSPATGSGAHPLFPVQGEHFVSIGVTLRHRNLSFHLTVQHGFDAAIDIETSGHGPLFDGSRLTLRQEAATIGFSYEY
jgi:long-subunit fatty acid transport protein